MAAMWSRSFALSGAACVLAYFLVVSRAIAAVDTTDTTATPASRQAQSPAGARETLSVENDARIRREVLDSLARELESRYAAPDMAKKLAAVVGAKQTANAYKQGEWRDFAGGDSGRKRRLHVCVNGVPPIEAARSAIAAAFAFLHNTDALIIDNRGNGGGDPNTVALHVSYLSEGKPYVVNTFHWREGTRVEEFKTTDLGELTYGAQKPVFVLTSPETFSGGEELTYDLQALKRAVIVGEVTGGGANPGGPIRLGHQLVVNMPSGQAVNPITGTSWEGVGVKPDIPVRSADALSKAHALAVERLRAAASDAISQSMLDAVSMKLETIRTAESGSSTRLPNAELLGTYVPEVGAGTTADAELLVDRASRP